MKNSLKRTLSAALALFLVVVLTVGAVPVSAKESDKLVDKFYDETIHKYYDDVYAAIYSYAVDQGVIADAIASIDAMIAIVMDSKAQIPEPPVVPDLPEDGEDIEIKPEEVPWDDVPEIMDTLVGIDPGLAEAIPDEVIQEVPADVIEKLEENGVLDKIPTSVLDKVPQETIDQLPDDLRDKLMGMLGREDVPGDVEIPGDIEIPDDFEIPGDIEIPEDFEIPMVFSLRNTTAQNTNSSYEAYVNFINALNAECDELIATLEELKAILQGDEITTWEGLVEKVHYLEEELPVRINRIQLLWGVVASYAIDGLPMYDETTDPEQVREDVLAAIDSMVKIEKVINEDLIPAIDAALKALADWLYDPACIVLETFLDKEINSANELVDAMEIVAGMTEKEIRDRVEQIVYEATHADYVIDQNSYYVSLGNIVSRNGYVQMLRELLEVPGKDLSVDGMSIEAAVDYIKSNKDYIQKADLITIAFGETDSLFDIIESVLNQKANEDCDWEKQLGQKAGEFEVKIKAMLDNLYNELDANGINGDQAEAIICAVETYAYKLVAHAVSIEKTAQAIQTINPEALIVVAGAYNPISELTITAGDKTVDLGSYIDYLFAAFGVYDLGYAIITEKFIYVDAPDVDVNMQKAELTTEWAANLKLTDLMPSETGHKYIATQIYKALNIIRTPGGEEPKPEEPPKSGDSFGMIACATVSMGAALALLISKRKYFI